MDSESILTKLVSLLATLRPSELRELEKLLKSPQVLEVLSDLIGRAASLAELEISARHKRKKRRRSTSRVSKSPKEVLGEALGHSGQLRGEDNLRDVLESLLWDRALFPSTRDVLETINRVFKAELKYESFKRAGRRPLISFAIRELKSLGSEERAQILRKVVPPTVLRETNGYKELFKVLTSHEQNT